TTLGEEQKPWLELLRSGYMSPPRQDLPPPTLVSPYWRDQLETAETGNRLYDRHVAYHLGVARWHAGDRSQAVRSWEQIADAHWPSMRCLAVADEEDGHPGRAADRFLAAFEGACAARREGPEWTAATTALGRETIEALLAVDRADEAASVLLRLRPAVRERGRFRLLHARILLAQGDTEGARAIFDSGFEVDDLREGDGVLTATWRTVAPSEPMPHHYDFRMRPE
ncbi:DUF5107 domain-containing protein, partial [Streptomyces sp. UNOC14_S4]|nr:DUF5107 domain-containing protein [Streptomyces sp. UNOC14_S4]